MTEKCHRHVHPARVKDRRGYLKPKAPSRARKPGLTEARTEPGGGSGLTADVKVISPVRNGSQEDAVPRELGRLREIAWRVKGKRRDVDGQDDALICI